MLKASQSFAGVCHRSHLHGKSERLPQSCGKVTTALPKGCRSFAIVCHSFARALPQLCQSFARGVCRSFATDFARGVCRSFAKKLAAALPEVCHSFAKKLARALPKSWPELCQRVGQRFATGVCRRPHLHDKSELCGKQLPQGLYFHLGMHGIQFLVCQYLFNNIAEEYRAIYDVCK